MKKQVSDFVKSLGGTASYSGKHKIMFIDNNGIEDGLIELRVVEKFGYGLPFKLKTNS